MAVWSKYLMGSVDNSATEQNRALTCSGCLKVLSKAEITDPPGSIWLETTRLSFWAFHELKPIRLRMMLMAVSLSGKEYHKPHVIAAPHSASVFEMLYPFLVVAYPLLDFLGSCAFSMLPLFLNGSVHTNNSRKLSAAESIVSHNYAGVMNHIHCPWATVLCQ